MLDELCDQSEIISQCQVKDKNESKSRDVTELNEP